MNGTAYNQPLMKRMNRWLAWPLLCGLLGLMLTLSASATDPIYVNSSPQSYTVPGNPPPNIDATAFDNENLFNISFQSFLYINPILYETQNTLYYTNNDTMTASSPFSISGFTTTVGCGYQFDFRTGSGRYPAGFFYNPGMIRCNSLVDGNVVLNFFGVNNFAIQTSIGEALVSATNIINPGTLQVGLNGLIQLTGQNVDISRGTFLVESSTSGTVNPPGISATGDFGANTNLDWDPNAALTATTAYSSLPNYFFLNNSTPYFDIQGTGTTNWIVRAVFIANPVSNVVNQVSFDSNAVGGGYAHVEWDGTYVDPATGQTHTNYLYLSNDYVLGASTNVTIFNGIPSNFQFVEGGPHDIGTLTAPGFQDVFFPGAITNLYSYTDAQFIPTTATTNVTVSNPYGSLTNLPGRIQISASKQLNLALANISGQNYMSLSSPNQFNGNVGAQIISPYSDINLGVTNGFLTLSNLLQSVIPAWSGTVQAWSTRWIYTDTNSGITLDYRVMLVDSRVTPVSFPTVQDLVLHATNSLVVSDVLNVSRTLSIDSKSLTITTNGFGVGASSPDGELNWSFGPANNTLGSSQLPNLQWLTNNGAIRTRGSASLGSTAPNNYKAIVNRGLLAPQGFTANTAYFENTGVITNGSGSFGLFSQTAVLNNGGIFATNGDVAFTSGSLIANNLTLRAGRSLTLRATNMLNDTVDSGNTMWVGGSSSSGINLPIKPAAGDLLGTTITAISPAGKNVVNTWAATNAGASIAGYTNNAAIGRLILDGGINSVFTFNGTGTNNAIYVDYLELRNQATNYLNQNVTALAINPNIVIYYAQAVINGVSVAEKLNGYNGNHLRWVSSYAGHFSSTNFVYPDGFTTLVNTALVQSKNIDSDGDGIVNGSDPTPFYISSDVNFTSTLTNVPPLAVLLNWQTMPSATNYVYYRTNLVTAPWLLLTNFVTPPAPPYAPVRVQALDSVNPVKPRYYRVRVDANTVNVYGP